MGKMGGGGEEGPFWRKPLPPPPNLPTPSKDFRVSDRGGSKSIPHDDAVIRRIAAFAVPAPGTGKTFSPFFL